MGIDIFVTVIFFLPPPKEITIPTAYHKVFMGQVTRVDFQVIKIWELAAQEVLGYDNPMLLPFVPLMQGGEETTMLRRCANRIRQEPEAIANELEALNVETETAFEEIVADYTAQLDVEDQ